MAFAWTAVAVGSIFTAAHYNQVKTNTDTLCSNLGIANYGWTLFPVSTGTDRFDYNDTAELRLALDYVKDNNICVSNNADKDTTVDSDQHTGYYTDKDTTVDSDQHTSYNSGTNSPVNSGQNTGVK
jgi:hypothetical protein